MLLLSRKDIQRVFTMRDAIEADKLAFRMLAEGAAEVPLRTNIQAPQAGGTFLFMPAYAESLEAGNIPLAAIFCAEDEAECLGKMDHLQESQPYGKKDACSHKQGNQRRAPDDGIDGVKNWNQFRHGMPP